MIKRINRRSNLVGKQPCASEIDKSIKTLIRELVQGSITQRQQIELTQLSADRARSMRRTNKIER